MEIMTFSANVLNRDSEGSVLLDQATLLTKQALQNYSTKKMTEEYASLNADVKQALINYSAKRANIDSTMYDLTSEMGFSNAMEGNTQFRETFFSVLVNVINTVQSKSDVEDALKFAQVLNVADGDSLTLDIAPKALFKVEDHAYSNNVSVYNYEFMSQAILAPKPKDLAVAVDLFQMTKTNFDFGRTIAKVILSFRAKMLDDVISTIYNAPITSTPFYSASFAQTTWQQLAQRVGATNGAQGGVMAYGSLAALGKMSASVGDKFIYGHVGEEVLRNGFVRDIFGVPTTVIGQAINPNDANYSFKVPDDKVILLTNTDKPVKVAMSGQTKTIVDNGLTNATALKSVKFQQSWDVQLATASAFGIQKL